jgi:hypothetical protein
MGINGTSMAVMATVRDWPMLNAVMPASFQLPANVKLKAKEEQSANPTKTTPIPRI